MTWRVVVSDEVCCVGLFCVMLGLGVYKGGCGWLRALGGECGVREEWVLTALDVTGGAQRSVDIKKWDSWRE